MSYYITNKGVRNMKMNYFVIKNKCIDTLLIDRIYFVTSNIEKCYPKHKEWFYQKFIPGLENGERIIVYCQVDKEIAGVVFLKNTPVEKKICTIYVSNNFRNKRIGTRLLEYSFDILQTSKPLITFSEEKLEYFEKIIKKYSWELVETRQDLYQKGKKEYFYNGK